MSYDNRLSDLIKKISNKNIDKELFKEGRKIYLVNDSFVYEDVNSNVYKHLLDDTVVTIDDQIFMETKKSSNINEVFETMSIKSEGQLIIDEAHKFKFEIKDDKLSIILENTIYQITVAFQYDEDTNTLIKENVIHMRTNADLSNPSVYLNAIFSYMFKNISNSLKKDAIEYLTADTNELVILPNPENGFLIYDEVIDKDEMVLASKSSKESVGITADKLANIMCIQAEDLDNNFKFNYIKLVSYPSYLKVVLADTCKPGNIILDINYKGKLERYDNNLPKVE